MPPGWYNSRRDLARHSYFSRGEGICGFLEEHGFHYVYPVMMDDFNTYLIRGKKAGETTLTYFVWYPIVGTVFEIMSKNLEEIVDIMGRSVLALDMAELEDGDSATTTSAVPEPEGGSSVPRIGRGEGEDEDEDDEDVVEVEDEDEDGRGT